MSKHRKTPLCGLPEGVSATRGAHRVLTMLACGDDEIVAGRYRCKPTGWTFSASSGAGTWAWSLEAPMSSGLCGSVGSQHRVQDLWAAFKDGRVSVHAHSFHGSTELLIEDR